MSYVQPSLTADEPSRLRSAFSSISPGVIAGLAVVGLGGALFALGLYHAFEHGSCSTTGYSANYGPVQHCAKGVGWWMLCVFGGIFAAVIGGLVARMATAIAPVMFLAVGAPFVALGLRSSQTHLMTGASAGSGKIFAIVFGGAFVLAGAAWGVAAGMGALSRASGGARLAGALALVAGVGVAFAIAGGISGAIGRTTPPATQSIVQNGTVQPGTATGPDMTGAAKRTTAALKRANVAISKAEARARMATKLAACVTAAGTDIAKVQACENKYMK